jgi:hypothetical protein
VGVPQFALAMLQCGMQIVIGREIDLRGGESDSSPAQPKRHEGQMTGPPAGPVGLKPCAEAVKTRALPRQRPLFLRVLVGSGRGRRQALRGRRKSIFGCSFAVHGCLQIDMDARVRISRWRGR